MRQDRLGLASLHANSEANMKAVVCSHPVGGHVLTCGRISQTSALPVQISRTLQTDVITSHLKNHLTGRS